MNIARSFPSLAVLAAITAGLSLSGCRIEFDAQSVVMEDGAIERTTTFSAQEDSDKQEILSRYELPEGGGWTDQPLQIFAFIKKGLENKMTAQYQAVALIEPETGPSTDFKRFSQSRERFAKNEFRVKVKDWWLVKWFDYEEKFSDIIDLNKVQIVINKVLDKGLEIFHAELTSRAMDSALTGPLIEKARIKYGGVLNRYFELAMSKGWDIESVDKLTEEIKIEFTSEAASAYFAKELKDFDTPASRQITADAFHATEKTMDEYLSNDPELQSYGDEIFGVHGMAIFQYYDFKIRVKMPGRVIASNSQEKERGFLAWSFNSAKMDRTLTARSRKVYWLRVALAGLVLLIPAVLMRKKKKRK